MHSNRGRCQVCQVPDGCNPKHNLLNLGKSRIRARDGRVTPGVPSAGAPLPERRGGPDAAADRGGPHPVSCVSAGPDARSGCRPVGGRPDPRAGHLMSPLSGVPPGNRSCAPPTRRDGDLCPFASPSALRRLGLPPPSRGPSPLRAGVPVICGHKALPSAQGFGYNPHSL